MAYKGNDFGAKIEAIIGLDRRSRIGMRRSAIPTLAVTALLCAAEPAASERARAVDTGSPSPVAQNDGSSRRASDVRDTVLRTAGPALSVQQATILGEPFQRYENRFRVFAERHWRSDGHAWDAANYYDRAKIFYVWWARTGDDTLLKRAGDLAVDYRTNYLEANDYGTSAHWSQIAGVALHYLATGDEASRTAVGRVADTFALPYYSDNVGNVKAEMDQRIQARTLESFLYAKQINAPSAAGNNWDKLLTSSLDKILSAQSADGAWHFSNSDGAVVPFMAGMLNDTLIDYYTNYKADARIPAAIKKSVDYLWSHTWDEKSQSFNYIEFNAKGEVKEPAPDLNNMIVDGFGFVYKMTGDATYKERGDKIFTGGVNGAWLEGSKQFNQQYTTSYRYASLREQGEAKR
ncbi:hypothetical protein [Microvirga sp. TS319]|uniref:hypothetical protein n=1 Tax=Microvirga sp. TS319 TaxID=3241165 RepID=UPI00351A4B89